MVFFSLPKCLLPEEICIYDKWVESNAPFDKSASLCLRCLGMSPTELFHACAQLRVRARVCGVCLCAHLDALGSSVTVRTSDETGESRWLGGGSIVSRHQRGHFCFLMCHLQLPQCTQQVCLLSPLAFGEAAWGTQESLLVLPGLTQVPTLGREMPAFSRNLFVPGHWQLGDPSPGFSWLLGVSWPPSGPSFFSSLCMEKVADSLGTGEEEQSLDVALLPRVPSLQLWEADPSRAWWGVRTRDLSLVTRPRTGPCWGIQFKTRRLLQACACQWPGVPPTPSRSFA